MMVLLSSSHPKIMVARLLQIPLTWVARPVLQMALVLNLLVRASAQILLDVNQRAIVMLVMMH